MGFEGGGELGGGWGGRRCLHYIFLEHCRRIARTQSSATRNYTPEFSTFGKIENVNPTEVQWSGLNFEGPP